MNYPTILFNRMLADEHGFGTRDLYIFWLGIAKDRPIAWYIVERVRPAFIRKYGMRAYIKAVGP